MTKPYAKDVIAHMYRWRGNLLYRQTLGVYDPKIGGIRRPNPDVTKDGDCSGTIQNAFLLASNDTMNPGYYTEDMLTRGKRVMTSANPNWNGFKPGDVVVMQWPNGYYHVELVSTPDLLIGHGGPGRGPVVKSLRTYLSGASRWWVQRHPLADYDPVVPEKEEFDMSKPELYRDERAHAGTLLLKPGVSRYISKKKDAKTGSATNVTQKVPGTHSLISRVYAKGVPGDVVTVALVGQDRSKTPYETTVVYVVDEVIPASGILRKSHAWYAYRPSLKRYHYLRVSTPKGNKGNVNVTLFNAQDKPEN